jgi:hypothetical protein
MNARKAEELFSQSSSPKPSDPLKPPAVQLLFLCATLRHWISTFNRYKYPYLLTAPQSLSFTNPCFLKRKHGSLRLEAPSVQLLYLCATLRHWISTFNRYKYPYLLTAPQSLSFTNPCFLKRKHSPLRLEASRCATLIPLRNSATLDFHSQSLQVPVPTNNSIVKPGCPQERH